MPLTRLIRRLLVLLGKSLLYLTITALVVMGIALAILETGWAKNQIRRFVVRQANQYLTATLEIRRLEGSLVRGLQLGEVRLSRDGRTIVAIDDVALSYSLRDLFHYGVVIKRIRLARPRVTIARTDDGRWDLATLVKREARQEERTGPGRPITIEAIEVFDGTVTIEQPLDFGAVHAPTRYESLDVTAAFSYEPVQWRLTFGKVSWRGHGPDLVMRQLSGGIENGPNGTSFSDLVVRTPRSTFVLNGHIRRGHAPTILDLTVRAERFAFQEWAGVLRGLRNIAVEAAFDTALNGPPAKLATRLNLRSTAGSIAGALTLDTTVPGWRGAGRVDVGRLNLARWLNRSDRPSDITGRVTFDLALQLGRHFPQGTYEFAGPHAEFMKYAADDLRAHGIITPHEVHIAEATARAYGADVRTADSSIGLAEPFPFRFQGTTSGADLRRVPDSVPVPHVESVLTFDYDVGGQFSNPFINGRAQFARSVFLGALIEPGTVGTIDTSARPLRYSGDGAVRQADLRRLGGGLDIAWLLDARYAGTVSGRFRVSGTGGRDDSLALSATGRLDRADVFNGRLSDAGVALEIADGTVRMSYDGRFAAIDPSIPLASPRLAASITGAATIRATLRDVVGRTRRASDYDIEGSIVLDSSTVRGIHLDRAQLRGRYHDAVAELANVEVTGQVVTGRGEGLLALTSDRPSDFRYELTRVDLGQLRSLIGLDVAGQGSLRGQATGPWPALKLTGDAAVSQLVAPGATARTMTAEYDVTLPKGEGASIGGRLTGHGSFLTIFGERVETAAGTFSLTDRRLGVDVTLAPTAGRTAILAGAFALHSDRRAVDMETLSIGLAGTTWRLVHGAEPATIAWDGEGLKVSPLELVESSEPAGSDTARAAGDGDQKISISGTWRGDGNGALRIAATHLFLETLQGTAPRPARYGGAVDLDGTVAGTRAAPRFSGRLTVSKGRVRRVSYERLEARIDYADDVMQIDARLDQAPGAWITAAGRVPLGLFDTRFPARDIDVAIASSPLSLGLIEGLTDVVRNVSGEVRLDVKASGTSLDPLIQGSVSVSNAAFVVGPTGVRYEHGRIALSLAGDRVTVEAFHVEDNSGRPLDVRGSLATRALSIADLVIDAHARHFKVIRNEFGDLDVDATLQLRGQLPRPRIAGDISIAGGELKVDAILDRALFRPYAVEPAPLVEVDAVAALNPWNRLSLDLTLHVPETLRLTGENLQVSPGTPIGLGDINLRVGGDLSLYKDPEQQLSITGSLDSVSGTYAFQGRRFEVDPASSINFRGDLTPGIDVSVTRDVSGVLTRVTVTGDLKNPELHLSSTPPLEPSEILSLIVFNSSLNDLSVPQQQELAVRAATIAAGFLAEPLTSALEGALGLETLEVEPGGDPGVAPGPKITVGEEIAPGLVARFSRQFGQDSYDQATVEYYLSRVFHIRATFSDAASLIARAPFRRIERAGIDLLIFFSF